MLRYAVLIVGLEQPTDYVCVVPVRPYSRLWNLNWKVILRPEYPGRIMVFVVAAERGSRGRLGFE